GSFVNNLPAVGATIQVFKVDPQTGERLGEAVHRKRVGRNGHWGPFDARSDASYEFEVTADGYPVNHVYRSPFPRSSGLIHLQLRRMAVDDDARPIISMTRPRGHFDAERGRRSVGGISRPPVVRRDGAGVSR